MFDSRLLVAIVSPNPVKNPPIEADVDGAKPWCSFEAMTADQARIANTGTAQNICSVD
jgi:hypothetical protein